MTPGNYYDELDFVRSDLSAGTLRSRAGDRLICLTGEFWEALSRSLDAECGPAAGRVLASTGQAWGRQFGEDFERQLSEFEGVPIRERSFGEFVGRLSTAMSHHGLGLVSFDLSQAPIGIVIASVEHSPVASGLLGGFLAGVLSHLSGQNLAALAVEQSPRRKYLITVPGRLERVADAPARGQSTEAILAALAEIRAA